MDAVKAAIRRLSSAGEGRSKTWNNANQIHQRDSRDELGITLIP